MMYTIENNKIIIPQTPDFSAMQTLECGQVFRFKKTDFGYEVYSLHHRATIYCQKDSTIIECSDVKYFVNYFDLDTNYAKIKQELVKDSFLKSAVVHGHGIRILKQDSFEAILSFIISANNNIPRIKKIIEAICQGFGKNMGDYFAFPTLQELKGVTKDFFKEIGAGYRDEYLYKTIKLLNSGFSLDDIKSLPVSEAIEKLRQLSGVGPKVADCILLYGFYVTYSFPTDTWIKKVYLDFNPQVEDMKKVPATVIRNFFVNRYGNLSGYAQQYLFYYKREV